MSNGSNTPLKFENYIEQVNLLDVSNKNDEQNMILCDRGDLNNNLKQNSNLVK